MIGKIITGAAKARTAMQGRKTYTANTLFPAIYAVAHDKTVLRLIPDAWEPLLHAMTSESVMVFGMALLNTILYSVTDKRRNGHV